MTSGYDWKKPKKNGISTPVRNIEISFAENGVEVTVRHEEPKRKPTKGGRTLPEYDWESLNKKYVFDDRKKASAFVASKMA